MLFWGHTAEKPPTEKVTIGHENTGIVVAIGSKVTGFQVGDKVGCLGCSYACCMLIELWLPKTNANRYNVNVKMTVKDVLLITSSAKGEPDVSTGSRPMAILQSIPWQIIATPWCCRTVLIWLRQHHSFAPELQVRSFLPCVG